MCILFFNYNAKWYFSSFFLLSLFPPFRQFAIPQYIVRKHKWYQPHLFFWSKTTSLIKVTRNKTHCYQLLMVWNRFLISFCWMRVNLWEMGWDGFLISFCWWWIHLENDLNHAINHIFILRLKEWHYWRWKKQNLIG